MSIINVHINVTLLAVYLIDARMSRMSRAIPAAPEAAPMTSSPVASLVVSSVTLIMVEMRVILRRVEAETILSETSCEMTHMTPAHDGMCRDIYAHWPSSTLAGSIVTNEHSNSSPIQCKPCQISYCTVFKIFTSDRSSH